MSPCPSDLGRAAFYRMALGALVLRLARAAACCAGIGVLGALGTPPPALASPWTLPRGEVAISTAFEYQRADSEFLDERGDERPFPLRGRYDGATFNLAGRFGLTDRLELELSLPFRLVSYRSDPVILLDRPEDSPLSPLDFFQENILDFSQTRVGTGDLTVAGRYQLWLDRLGAFALELRLDTPTGYEGPAGTFGERPRSQEEFLADLPRFVAPENVTDDVTLGAGVFTVRPGLLLGLSFPSRTFLRVDGAYELRFGGGGDQVVWSFKVGQLLGDRLLVYAETRGTWAVTTGRVIGISVAAANPDLPAADFAGAENLVIREVTLDRDAIDVGGGVLYRLTDQVEVFLGGSRIVYGRNTAAVGSIFTGFAVRTDLRPDPGDAS
jgi:hypothetical protein